MEDNHSYTDALHQSCGQKARWGGWYSFHQCTHNSIKENTVHMAQNKQVGLLLASTMQGLHGCLLLLALTCLGQIGMNTDAWLLPVSRLMTHRSNTAFIVLSCRTWESNHRWGSGAWELNALHGLSAEQPWSCVWRISGEWRVCGHCGALWQKVSVWEAFSYLTEFISAGIVGSN